MGWLHVGLSSVLSDAMLRAQMDALGVTRVLVAVWAVLSSLEWLVNLDLFGETGLLFQYRRLSGSRLLRPNGRVFDAILSRRGVAGLLILRLVAAVVLAVTRDALSAFLGLAVLTATFGFFLLAFGEHWYDGSDKMGMIVSGGTLLVAAGLLLGDPLLALSGTIAVGGQLTVSYFVSGACKIPRAEWRNGRYLASVMDSHNLGRGALATLIRTPPLAFVVSWCLMLGEIVFPLALLAPHPVLVSALAAFLVLHVMIAWIMGLNLFVWAFVAAYPSVLLLGAVVRGALGWAP